MGKSKDLATGETRFVNTSGDSMTGELLVRRARSNTAGDAALTIHPSDTTVSYGLRIDQNTNSLNFDQVNSGVTRMSIDSAGRVTKPSQPAWRIGRNSSYTVTNGQGTSTAINFDLINDTTRRFFTQGGITVSSGVVTVPVAGVYSVSSTTRLDGVASGYVIMQIRINNDTSGSSGTYNIQGPSGFSSSYQTWTENTIFKLDASDTIRVYHYISNDSSFDVNYISYFSGYLLG